jgi:hypothetical protein
MTIQRSLDPSLKDRIVSPSVLFQEFLNQYFLTFQIYMRGEQDAAILDRLQGDEREVAIEMILANLRSGRPHLIDSAVQLDIQKAAPILASMRSEDYDEYEQYIIARALHSFHAIDTPDLFSISEKTLRSEASFATDTILGDSYRLFSMDDSRRLIDIGLRCSDYHIRARAYDAVGATHLIEAGGGQYTESLASELWKKQMAAATVGAPEPMYYEQLQYYVGDAVFADDALFEMRLAELWSKDPRARRVPLFTEQ